MKGKRRKRTRRILLVIAAVLIAAFVADGIWCNTVFGTTRYTVDCDVAHPVRIAQVSDLHTAVFGRDNEELISRIREESPDLIAVTGDLVDSRRPDVDTAIRFLEQAVGIAPCYYVTGNHEADYPGYPELERKIMGTGTVVLRNEAADIDLNGSRIRLIGIDDPLFVLDAGTDLNAAAMKGILSGLTEDGAVQILLSHRPEIARIYEECGIDLVLSGHAHGGQIRIPFVGGLYAPNQGFFPSYDSGLYQLGETEMIVSRGLGNSRFPLRINNQAELVLVTVE